MKVNTWMPLFVGDLIVDTLHLTAEQFGAYMLLICHYWRQGEALRDDDDALATITRTNGRWSAVRTVLTGFFDLGSRPGFWVHRRVERELENAMAIRAQKIAAGKASAAQRALQRDGQRAGNGSSTSVATPVPTATATKRQRRGNPSPSPITPSPSLRSGVSPTPKAKGTMLPEDFDISNKVRRWARERGYEPFLAAHLEHFRNYAASGTQSGKPVLALDWDAKFRNCIADDWGGVREKALRSGKADGKPVDPRPWFLLRSGIEAKAKEQGEEPWDPDDGEPFPIFASRVLKRSGITKEQHDAARREWANWSPPK